MKANDILRWIIKESIEGEYLNTIDVPKEGDESWEQNETWWLETFGGLPPMPIAADKYLYYYDTQYVMLSFLDTLEVKEVDSNDAFIEKACDWLSDTLQTVVDVNIPSAHHVESIPALGIITQSEFIEKFKKEIKFLLD